MRELLEIVQTSQEVMARRLERHIARTALDEDSYARYLTMQYHLTRGVQRYFLAVAANPAFTSRRVFRTFLFGFANEEEQHFQLAERDLASLGRAVGNMPFDVELWHSYFERVTPVRPFVRLGAACVLENISAGAVRQPLRQLLAAPFLNERNTRFIVLHQHETLPHGEQIIAALRAIGPHDEEVKDLVLGAKRGAVLYLRMTDWVLGSEEEYFPFLEGEPGQSLGAEKIPIAALDTLVSTAPSQTRGKLDRATGS